MKNFSNRLFIKNFFNRIRLTLSFNAKEQHLFIRKNGKAEHRKFVLAIFKENNYKPHFYEV